MVCANADLSLIGTDVIDPIGVGSPEFGVDKIVNLDLYRIATGLPRRSGVLVDAY
jgi:hypothetical protein